MYDIIGDIHGYAEPLKRLLLKLDYTEGDGSWNHPGRKVIFVGDYIDRGPAIRETLQIVKSMSDAGSAVALLGNHEYNALAYQHEVNGIPLRKHNEKNSRQHKSTLDQFTDHWEEWQLYLDWFYTLPLFFEDNGIRAVHACWDDEHIQWLKDNNKITPGDPEKKVKDEYITMNAGLLIDSHNKRSKSWEVIEETLKGKEFDIPEEYAWPDKDGQLRKSNRIKWWVEQHAQTFEKWLFDCPPEIREQIVTSGAKPYVYPADAPPVFFGHYWMEDKFPVIQEKNIVCLDYSIAKKGNLVAYRWSGEKELIPGNFVSVSYKE